MPCIVRDTRPRASSKGQQVSIRKDKVGEPEQITHHYVLSAGLACQPANQRDETEYPTYILFHWVDQLRKLLSGRRHRISLISSLADASFVRVRQLIPMNGIPNGILSI